MNGVHDMGGLACYGRIENPADDTLFHADWEKSVLALTLAAGSTGVWNLDISRAARESLTPSYYLSAGYYRIWLAALENLLVDHKMLTREELACGESLHEPTTVPRILYADQVDALFQNGSPVQREPDSDARFEAGGTVRVKNHQPATHTRLPAYIRGQQGVVSTVHGCHVYPDSHALRLGEDPKWLYNVQFDAADLWGGETRRGDQVHVDCWEPYLEGI